VSSKLSAQPSGLVDILCVDDEPNALMLEKELLESAGFRVLTASSGPEAIRVFESKRVDIVIMDYWMVGMNGITAAQKIKQLEPDVPIIFYSAYTELPSETLGLAEYWIKKNEEDPEQILARLRALADKQSVRRRQAS
jgi:CheY-like chemotaxis protein